MVDVGDLAPDFSLRGSTGEAIALSQFKGKKNVILSWHVATFTGG